jgi:pimeloyl-ACP methyl ester carboxylesterase
MTTRRTFIAGSLSAAAALALPTAARAETRSARIRTKDSTELHVKEWGGRGRTVIFTHAWPLSADIWDHQAAAMAEAGYRVLAYDRRGFGRSSQPAAGYDFDTLSDDLAAVIAETGARDITLVGYSMGGSEIVRYFSRHGGKQVAKAALVGAAASYLLKTDANPDGLDRTVFDGIKQGVLGDRKGYLAGLLSDVFFDAKRPASNPVTPATIEWAVGIAMQAGLEATVACVDSFSLTDFRPELASMTVPTLVLHGTADIPVPIALARITARGIRQSTMIEYADVSHGLVVTERDRVTRDLQAFIAR